MKERAGINNLNKYANEFEIQILCKILNCSYIDILRIDDNFATKILLMNQEDINFQNKLFELKSKK